MRHALLVTLLGAALLSGCRDLSVPPPEATAGVGPNIRVLLPLEGQRISLLYPVRLQVEDLDGVSEVTLRCGGLTLWTWLAPPYEATVDFNACRQLAPTGASEFSAPLSVRALDAQGNAAVAELSVNMDVEAPGLAVQSPSRVAPGGSVTVTVQSDRPLQGPPSVRLAGTALAITQDGPQSFTATGQAPGLGTDGVAPSATGCAYPIELLEEVERTLVLTVSGRSLGGNETAQDRPLVVSRVAWEKAVPGELYLEATSPQADATFTRRPTAAAAGLQVPLQVSQGVWVPALFRVADGTFVPFPSSLFGNNYRGQGFDALGRTLLDDSSQLLMVEPGEETGTPIDVPSRFPGTPMTRVGDALCVQQASACRTETFQCVRKEGYFESNTLVGVTGDGLGGAARWLVRSGDVLLGLDFAASTACCAACGGRGIIGPIGSLSYRSVLPATTSQILRVLPTGAGNFVVSYTSAAGVPGTALVPASGATQATAFSSVPSSRTLLLARRDDALVTTDDLPSTTPFELWRPGATSPERQGCLPGDFAVPQPLPLPVELPTDAVEGSDGEVTFVMANEQYGRVVVHLDGQLVPKWVYRYPRLIVSEANHPNHFLVGGTTGPVYFVDAFNGYVVALGR